MVKTTESTTLLENNSSPNCLSQASDYDGNGFKNNQIKTQNGGTTSSELQTTSTNDYSTIVVPPSSSTTGHLTVEKYILQLQQKDERINTLKEENKRLRSTLISKTSEFQNRVDELVAELERQDEIVKKLRNDLAICRRTVSNPSTQITLKEPLSKKFSSLSASSSFSLQDSSSFPSNRTTNNSFKDIIEGNSDDICAKLQNFCERNNLGNIQQLQQQQQLPLETRKRRATKSAVSTPIKKQPCLEPLNIYQNANNNNDVDQENQLQQQQNLIPFTEQLCKLIAENPTTLLPAAALIFVSASITQPPPIAEEVEEKIQEEEEEEENIIEEEEQENYKNIKEENETFDQQQQQQTCSVDAETADNFLSFLMESTNGGANNSSTTVPTPCFTSTSSFCDNSQKKQKNNRRNKLRRNSTNNNQIIETPSQKQQNLDFEEVMQRVIGEAMNGTVNNSDNVVIEKQQNVLDQNKHKITTTTTFVSSPIPAEIITTTLPVNKQDYSLLSATHKTQNNDLKLNNLPHHHSSATAKPFTPEEQKLADELEARIDANIIKLGTCPLNPIELAVQCTRLMRDYGIGQRLFARTVMCKVSKSQGSLSELLSKPRPWNKLTDKNRDSFRRIYAWITDDKAIDLLCQLSPRKVAGAEKIIHPDPKTLVELPESVVDGKGETLIVGNKSETKIIENDKKVLRQSSTTNFILKDVKTEIPSLSPIQNNNNLTIKQQLSPNNNLITTTTLLEASSSIDDNNLEKVGEKIGGGGGGGRWRHDDIPREKIIGILEAEKAKLLEIENNNKTTIEFLPQNIITTTTTTTTPNRRGRSATTANIPPTPLEDNNNLINSSSQLLVNELGINTPIGTILKKANSPIPATSSLNGGGKELENKKTHLNKRKTFTPTSINNNNTTTPLIKPEASLLTGSTATSSSSTAKRLPRFQRTIITDRQKEALIFIYIHEQRPNSKLIEQLAAKVGLQARTVNNWFHNHRTRNKEKQIKNDDETGLITTIKSSHSTTPTPTQVLSKALNAADIETAKWFRELAELLHLYSDNTTTNNIQDINYNNIYFNLSSLNNNNSKNTSPAPERINNEEDILSNGNSSAISSPTASLTKKNNISQLDRAIARIHSRLSTEGF